MAKSHSKQPQVHNALLKALPFIQFTLPTDGFRPTLHCQDIFAGGKLLTQIIKKRKKHQANALVLNSSMLYSSRWHKSSQP